VWIGSKTIDGYCHDCYVRGRHLPDDNEPWAGSPPPKHRPKPSGTPVFSPPQTSKPAARRRLSFPKIRRNWLLLPLILAALALIFNGAFWLKSLIVSLSGDTAAINTIREESSTTFYRRGEKLTYEDIYTNIKAINEFVESNASYRISGEFVYGYKDGRGTLANNFTTAAQADVEMSYNGETDVHKFIISNSGDETDELLKGYMVADGTYYIVTENGKTYVLSDIYGDKAAVDISVDTSLYNILTSYFMENVINTSLIDKEATAYQLWDGVQYDRAILLDNPGFLAFPDTRVALRAFQNKPVTYVYRNPDDDSEIEYNFEAGFYYDDIPQDAPTVAEYMQ
jgi:hypothetical protein